MMTRLQGLEDMEKWMTYLQLQQEKDAQELALEELDDFIELSFNE